MNIRLILIFCLLSLGCTTTKKAKLESSKPAEVVSNVQALRNDLIESNSDLLAKKSFTLGEKSLKTAIEGQSKDWPRDKVLDKLAESKAHFLDAKRISRLRKIVPENILEARSDAIETDLYSNKELKRKLSKIDNAIINDSATFSKPLSTENLSRYQMNYQELTVESIQDKKLGDFRKIIQSAERKEAKRLAPDTLRDAKNKVNFSANLIRLSPKNSYGYSESIGNAKKAVKLLDDVMNKLAVEAKGSSEATALKLVYQEQTLGNLNDEVNYLQSSLERTSEEVGEVAEDLAKTEDELEVTKSKLSFQQAMEEARKSFKENEADIYQQGGDLIIRLKKISFRSGSAQIPAKSMALLSKANSIITRLHPKEVKVEGHTDSFGKEANNLMLSKERAKSVKKYLSSLDVPYKVDARGYGESKPIANNETKMGRAQNRRVDIVVKGEAL